jgi:hypothetical protein
MVYVALGVEVYPKRKNLNFAASVKTILFDDEE